MLNVNYVYFHFKASVLGKIFYIKYYKKWVDTPSFTYLKYTNKWCTGIKKEEKQTSIDRNLY